MLLPYKYFLVVLLSWVVSLDIAHAFACSTKSCRRRIGTRCHQAWYEESFDFASIVGWEKYYQRKESPEWHSSVSLETIADYIPQGSKCLLVGCGTSRLPDMLQNKADCIDLLDSSQTCIDILRERYSGYSKIGFYCEDATKLSEYCVVGKYDAIVDKGLMDALLCGEGWNGPITRLLEESAQILEPPSFYLLISYKLPRSTREFLSEVGGRVGFDWTFDCDGSNDNVQISIASRRLY